MAQSWSCFLHPSFQLISWNICSISKSDFLLDTKSPTFKGDTGWGNFPWMTAACCAVRSWPIFSFEILFRYPYLYPVLQFCQEVIPACWGCNSWHGQFEFVLLHEMSRLLQLGRCANGRSKEIFGGTCLSFKLQGLAADIVSCGAMSKLWQVLIKGGFLDLSIRPLRLCWHGDVQKWCFVCWCGDWSCWICKGDVLKECSIPGFSSNSSVFQTIRSRYEWETNIHIYIYKYEIFICLWRVTGMEGYFWWTSY